MSGFLGDVDADDYPVFIQWKGTEVCMDFHCMCGRHNHYDGMFAYYVECGGCGQVWQMPCLLMPRKVMSGEDITKIHALKPLPDEDL